MLERMTIYLSTPERLALEALASSDMRNVREEIRFLVRDALEVRGLIRRDDQREIPEASGQIDDGDPRVAEDSLP